MTGPLWLEDAHWIWAWHNDRDTWCSRSEGRKVEENTNLGLCPASNLLEPSPPPKSDPGDLWTLRLVTPFFVTFFVTLWWGWEERRRWSQIGSLIRPLDQWLCWNTKPVGGEFVNVLSAHIALLQNTQNAQNCWMPCKIHNPRHHHLARPFAMPAFGEPLTTLESESLFSLLIVSGSRLCKNHMP